VKGLGIFIGIVIVAAVGCVWLPFIFLPSQGYGAALPVIYVPGEPIEVLGHLPGDIPVTNTMIATWITILFVWFWVIPIVQRRKDVPGRGQVLVEVIVETWDNLARASAGTKGRQLVPVALSIFFFLLVANIMKIIPGMDTIGELHCAGIQRGEEFIEANGYPIHGEPEGLVFLKVERVEGQAVNTGETLTYEEWKACKEALHPHEEEGDHAEAEEEDHSDEVAAAASTEEGEGGQSTATEEEHAEPTKMLFIVTPFVRGASTDLAVTVSIAAVAMILVQFFGIKELGIAGYGSKFINIPALERPPMGIMDFAVGILETFLEFFKLVSFAFRLFGAMFGGQVLMFVIVFLVATIVPVVVVGLEVFIGAIQAFVFAILFLMFSTVAMTSHSHDDHEHEEAHH